MAYLSIAEVLNRKYITDVSVATALLQGNVTLDEDVIKNYITQIGAYDEVYIGPADDPSTPEVNEHDDTDAKAAAATAAATADETAIETNDHNDANDIKFTVDEVEYVYKGKPTTTVAKGLGTTGYTGDLYEGEATEPIAGTARMSTLAGKVYTSTAVTEP